MPIHGQFAEILIATVEVPGVQEISDVGIGDAPIADTTAMNDTAQSSLKGIPGGGTIKITGLCAAGTTDHGGLATKAAASTSYAFDYRPEGTGVGKGKITGNAYVTSFVQSAAFAGVCQWTAQLAVTGAVTFGVQ